MGDFSFTGFVLMCTAVGTLMVDTYATVYFQKYHSNEVRNESGDVEKEIGHDGHVHLHSSCDSPTNFTRFVGIFSKFHEVRAPLNKFHEIRGHLQKISQYFCASPANFTRFVGLSNHKGKTLRYKITALVSILIAGAVGVCIPFLGKVIPALSPDKNVFFLLKAFVAGVILGTRFIRILLDAFENLTSPYLKEHPWEIFPSLDVEKETGHEGHVHLHSDPLILVLI
ncbi:hypothetical protein V8G54_009187 [Vigna mungo]|uniref:Uncharacterized protein n=1 Tax=Vigna mungo TaxID=3915 RepID=A0AAQ3NUP4_VIGMU